MCCFAVFATNREGQGRQPLTQGASGVWGPSSGGHVEPQNPRTLILGGISGLSSFNGASLFFRRRHLPTVTLLLIGRAGLEFTPLTLSMSLIPAS